MPKVAHCRPHWFLININGLLNEIEKCPELGAKFSKNKMSGLLFADDFVGIAETGPALPKFDRYCT